MIPVIELFVKSSNYDKVEFGAHPISQTWFMAFYLLVEKSLISLKITPVHMDIPPESYLQLNVSRRLPVAKIESGISSNFKDLTNTVYGTTDELEQLITSFKWNQLAMPNVNSDALQAEKIAVDVLKTFNILLKTKNNKPIISTLTKINEFLLSKPTKYLVSDEVTYADCVLMPRLQHVRVAGMEFETFDIPQNLKRLRDYIKDMYKEKVFQVSCPKSRDILSQHEDKVNSTKFRRSTSIKDDSKLMEIDNDN